jgi:hypothetical protein
MTALLASLGLQKRIKGSHHVLSKDGVEEIINIQPCGDKAKPYPVKQIRAVIVKCKLSGE